MKLSANDRALAAGAALEGADLGSIARVWVDGKEITSLDTARRLYSESRASQSGRISAFIDRQADRTARGVEAQLAKDTWLARLGQKLMRQPLLNADTEKVAFAARVEIEQKDGVRFAQTVDVQDVRASLILSRAAMLACMPSAVPGMPQFVSVPIAAGTALGTAIAGLVAVLRGRGPLAAACMKTALKLLSFGACGAVPIIGSLPCAIAVLNEARDLGRLKAQAPTVATMVNLGADRSEKTPGA